MRQDKYRHVFEIFCFMKLLVGWIFFKVFPSFLKGEVWEIYQKMLFISVYYIYLCSSNYCKLLWPPKPRKCTVPFKTRSLLKLWSFGSWLPLLVNAVNHLKTALYLKSLLYQQLSHNLRHSRHSNCLIHEWLIIRTTHTSLAAWPGMSHTW